MKYYFVGLFSLVSVLSLANSSYAGCRAEAVFTEGHEYSGCRIQIFHNAKEESKNGVVPASSLDQEDCEQFCEVQEQKADDSVCFIQMNPYVNQSFEARETVRYNYLVKTLDSLLRPVETSLPAELMNAESFAGPSNPDRQKRKRLQGGIEINLKAHRNMFNEYFYTWGPDDVYEQDQE